AVVLAATASAPAPAAAAPPAARAAVPAAGAGGAVLVRALGALVVVRGRVLAPVPLGGGRGGRRAARTAAAASRAGAALLRGVLAVRVAGVPGVGVGVRVLLSDGGAGLR